MSDQTRRANQSDPTAERTAGDQPSQTASGLSSGRPGPEVASEREADDLLNRSSEERYDTPRRYEEGDTDPALPADDATLNTKI